MIPGPCPARLSVGGHAASLPDRHLAHRDDYSSTLSSTDETNLTTYLSGGGKLFLSGQDIGYDINGDTSTAAICTLPTSPTTPT